MGLAASANAGTITYTASKGTTATNWTDTLSFSKFDSSLGTLTSITFYLSGIVNGVAKAESQDGSPTLIELSLSASLKLTRPDATTLVTTLPGIDVAWDATSYDGATDYAGTSGVSYLNLSAAASNSVISSSASDLALFTGPGTINLGVAAKGTSNGSGGGNLFTQFITNASALAKVTYTYAEPTNVPEPASLALIAGGFGLMGVARRRNKKA